MTHAIGAIIGVVEIVAGALLGGVGGEGLVIAGVGQLLGYAVSLLVNPRRAPLLPIGDNYAGTVDRRRTIFGKLVVASGDI